MNIQGKHYRTIWLAENGLQVEIIDQTLLPHRFKIVTLKSLADACYAISSMQVRGAPLIGATTAYGIFLAMQEDASVAHLNEACNALFKTRPTAVNLGWAIDVMKAALENEPENNRLDKARELANKVADDDVEISSSIGEFGKDLLQQLFDNKANSEPVNILTHCNAGWLATVDWGTALAPIYKAHEAGIPIHIWVDETRPRNQGASLTSFELLNHGIPHTIIADNVGGHLMQHGMVDICIVGTDRTAANGDVCNKVGTYLKALAAYDNDIPFYVALPSTTIDWNIDDGVADIPIEKRDAKEVTHISGKDNSGNVTTVQITPDGAKVANYSFDVTPAKYITGLITERGICDASKQGLSNLFNRSI